MPAVIRGNGKIASRHCPRRGACISMCSSLYRPHSQVQDIAPCKRRAGCYTSILIRVSLRRSLPYGELVPAYINHQPYGDMDIDYKVFLILHAVLI